MPIGGTLGVNPLGLFELGSAPGPSALLVCGQSLSVIGFSPSSAELLTGISLTVTAIPPPLSIGGTLGGNALGFFRLGSPGVAPVERVVFLQTGVDLNVSAFIPPNAELLTGLSLIVFGNAPFAQLFIGSTLTAQGGIYQVNINLDYDLTATGEVNNTVELLSDLIMVVYGSIGQAVNCNTGVSPEKVATNYVF